MNEPRNRPIITLFMLMSVDGKISTGSSDEFDVDKDFPNISGLKEGLHQYYEIEQTTDLWTFNTGKVKKKIGVNEKPFPSKTSCITQVILDNHQLTAHGIQYLCAQAKQLILITTNEHHPAFSIEHDALHIIYQESLHLQKAMEILYTLGCERLTVQSGGSVNALFLKEKLLDYIDIVVAPVLISGKDTPTLIDGESITNPMELSRLGILQLTNVQMLKDSYLRLQYQRKTDE